MNQEQLLKVLITPIISEKAIRVADDNRQFVFKVRKTSNKVEIKQAMEFMFNVKVDQVRIVNVSGKRKNFGRTRGKRVDWKKAYISLKEGYDINLGAHVAATA